MSKHIIIIGGMGPQASLSLHKRLIDKAAQLGARDGDEFPEITHLSLPIRDFISDPAAMPAALELIVSRLERLYLWPGHNSSHCL
jgi:aspartate/glutamate racemase